MERIAKLKCAMLPELVVGKRVPVRCSSNAFSWMKTTEHSISSSSGVGTKKHTQNNLAHRKIFAHCKAYAQRGSYGVVFLSLAYFSSFFILFTVFQALVDILPIFQQIAWWRSVFGLVFVRSEAKREEESVAHRTSMPGDKYASHTFVCIVQFDDIPPQMPTCTICNSSLMEKPTHSHSGETNTKTVEKWATKKRE